MPDQSKTAGQRIGTRLLRLEREMPQSEVALLQAILRQLVELNCSIYEMRIERGSAQPDLVAALQAVVAAVQGGYYSHDAMKAAGVALLNAGAISDAE